MKPHTHMQNYSRGIAMIEVLVTMIILSIGLLGLAGLQLTGMRSINSASLKTQATVLINDISERMRANPDAVDNNKFIDVDSAANIDCSAAPAPYCSEYFNAGSGAVAAASCTSDELADFDINAWFCGTLTSTGGAPIGGVQSVLPQASATITCTDTDPASGADADPCTDRSPHTITLSWSELNPNRSAGTNPVTQSIAVTIQP